MGRSSLSPHIPCPRACHDLDRTEPEHDKIGRGKQREHCYKISLDDLYVGRDHVLFDCVFHYHNDTFI